MHSTPATVYGLELTPEVGMYIFLDSSGINNGRKLLPCEVPDPIGEEWPGADFRIADPIFGEARGIAVNVHVTGRTIQRKQDIPAVRIRVEFVKDGGEPSVSAPGWMFTDR